MSPNQLPEESEQKQKDFYIKLREKINAWYHCCPVKLFQTCHNQLK